MSRTAASRTSRGAAPDRRHRPRRDLRWSTRRLARRLVVGGVLAGTLSCTAAPGPAPTPTPGLRTAPPATDFPAVPGLPALPLVTGTAAARVLAAGDAAARMVRDDLDWLAAHPMSAATSGLWPGDGSVCVRCAGGPALAAATLAAGGRDPGMLAVATTAFDSLIADHYDRATGTITPPMAGETGPDIQTSLFDGELGQAVLELGDRLDAAHRVRYTAVVVAGADFLVRNGDLAWYSNGNLVLANAATMAAAYALTGAPRYRAAYDRAWTFAVTPPQQRWPGRGLVYTRRPSTADGSDGAAYLSEQGAGGLGYDPEYTSLQLDTAIRVYLLSGDPRARRLAQLLLGQLLERVDRSTWILDASRGTRHDQVARPVVFRSGALAVLAATGRTDLAPALAGQVAALGTSIHSELPYRNPGTLYAYGISAAAVIWAATLVRRPASTIAPTPVESTGTTPTPLA